MWWKKRKLEKKAAYEEATSLWHDFTVALIDTHNPYFTERCTEISRRIIALGKVFGAVHWKDVPLTIVPSHYEITYARGGIKFPRVRWNRVNEVQCALNKMRASVFIDTPTTIRDFEMFTADMNEDTINAMNMIQLEGTGEHDFSNVHVNRTDTGRHHIA